MFTPARFQKVVGRLYREAQGPVGSPSVQHRQVNLVHVDIFNDRKRYKMIRIYTFEQRNIRVYVEYLNNFVRVYVEGADTGSSSWTTETLGAFSLGVKMAHDILKLSNEQGANTL